MSLLSLKESLIASVPTPDPGRYTYFIDSVSKQLYVKNSAGVSTPVSNFSDTFQLYPAAHTVSLTTSVYTLDLTGKPVPQIGKQINIKLTAPNTYSNIQIVIPGLGTFNFFKVGGVPFSAGELKAGQVISFIIDSGSAYYLSGFLTSGVITIADTAAMQSLMATNGLTVGAYYQFDFTTKYTLNGVTVSAPAPESLIVKAVTTGSVGSDAVSTLYPFDIIEVNIAASAPYGGKIVKRKDPTKNLVAPFDWRNVKFRRGVDPTNASFYTISNPSDPVFSTTFQDVFCFANSASGNGCSNITIEGMTFNTANSVLTPFIPWGLDNLNIVVTGGSNIHIKNSHSITVGAAFGPPNVSAMLNALIISNCWDCTMMLASGGVVENCKQVYMYGNIALNNKDFFSIGRFSVRNSWNITLLTSQAAQSYSMTEFDVENSSNVYMQATAGDPNKVKVTDCNAVWLTNCTQVELVDVQNSAFSQVTDSYYEHTSSLTVVSSTQERMASCRNLVSLAVSGTSLEGLKDAYQFRDKTCNVVAVVAGTPQTVVASIASATFANGDMISVTNSIALLSKATSIAFDTNADNIADTAAFPLVVGDFQKYYPAALAAAAGNFFLMYNNSKFFLVFSVLNCPFKVDTNNSQFDMTSSNFTKTVNFNAGAIAISDALNYDYGHIGILKVSHVSATDILSQITHTSGKYPSLRRELKNNSGSPTLTLVHGNGANLISMPGGLQRQLSNASDMAEIDFGAGFPANQWRVMRTISVDDSSYAQRSVIALNAAALKTANTLPILAVGAPGVNKAIRLIDAHLVYRNGTVAFNFASNIYFRYAPAVPASGVIPTSANLDTLLSQVIFFKGLDITMPLASLSNAGLQFICDANSAVGDGTATLVVNYRIIDLP